MSIRIAVVAVVAVGLLAQRSDLRAAQESSIKFYGIYSDSCGVWTADSPTRTSTHAQVQTWWVLGFVSGASVILSVNDGISVRSTDVAGITGWITKYCG